MEAATLALPHDLMMERFLARDRTYNGRFLTGVLSTGIYCLPSCPARRPREENVRFFATEDEARSANLRPCRRCRPDRFYRDEDPDLERLAALAEQVRREPGEFPDAAALAAASGFGATKLNALFRRAWHTTPAAFLQRARIDQVCRELLAGRQRVLDLALDAGWDSASAFHEAFRRAAGLAPGEYRRLARARDFVLDLPADYRTREVLKYLGRDPEGPCERVRGQAFAKAVRLAGYPAVLEVELAAGAARCRVEASGALPPEALGEAHAVALRLLGLAADPAPFERLARKVAGGRRLLAGREGLRIPLAATPFEGLAWTIIGQQINLAFATALRRRLVELCAGPAGGGLSVHPAPEAVARLEVADLLPLQYSRRKAEYLIGAARAVASGELPLAALADEPAPRVEKRLLALRGLGPWSAQYLMLRALGFADCVPAEDAGLSAALERFHGLGRRPGPDEARALLEPFAPFRSFATVHLWTSLGDTP